MLGVAITMLRMGKWQFVAGQLHRRVIPSERLENARDTLPRMVTCGHFSLSNAIVRSWSHISPHVSALTVIVLPCLYLEPLT